jgi:hypothetical protein
MMMRDIPMKRVKETEMMRVIVKMMMVMEGVRECLNMYALETRVDVQIVVEEL